MPRLTPLVDPPQDGTYASVPGYRNGRIEKGESVQLRVRVRNDTVIIFFAGHGAPYPDRQARDPDRIEKYLLPVDAEPEALFSSAIKMDDIYAYLHEKLPVASGQQQHPVKEGKGVVVLGVTRR